MGKEKFVRNPNPRNLGEIGERIITPDHYALVCETINSFQEQSNKRDEELLEKLIGIYGREEGINAYYRIKDLQEQNNKSKGRR